jgi:hypothetical protein
MDTIDADHVPQPQRFNVTVYTCMPLGILYTSLKILPIHALQLSSSADYDTVGEVYGAQGGEVGI